MKFEKRDLSLKAIMAGFVIFALTILIGAVGIWAIYHRSLLETRAYEPQALTARLFPRPRMERQPQTELTRLRQQEEKTLTTYSNKGDLPQTVRVPIERAMKEMAK